MQTSVAALAAFITLLAGALAHAQTVRPVLDYQSAEIIRDTCIAHAGEAETRIAVAVFDAGGDLVTFTKTDVPPGAGAVARWKGRSAAIYLTASAVTGEWDIPTAPDIATLGGGVPIFAEDGTGIGGVGVAGAEVDFDIECAIRGIKAAGLFAEQR